MTVKQQLQSSAAFSPCRTYRYSLWRRWGDESLGYVMFIGLNPSTADEVDDDPTIRRCIGYARDWGYGGLVMTNLFAYRATNPADMRAVAEPVGPDNDQHLLNFARDAKIVVAAWGNNGAHLGRDKSVSNLIPSLHVLKVTAAGQPGHPLYLSKALRPQLWLSCANQS
ncbi:DUF1643 domain-containing protein [Neopusillimonas aromaticivorans]|uniref:DUF1643 domain-containing protein n=1 Tax=Neopusillimonas aromaticivorans TaxID=2979868 RepID=UPI003D9E2010